MRVHVLTEGETLHSVAWAEYRQARYWRGLAAFNGIDDPLRVEPGTMLLAANAARSGAAVVGREPCRATTSTGPRSRSMAIPVDTSSEGYVEIVIVDDDVTMPASFAITFRSIGESDPHL